MGWAHFRVLVGSLHCSCLLAIAWAPSGYIYRSYTEGPGGEGNIVQVTYIERMRGVNVQDKELFAHKYAIKLDVYCLPLACKFCSSKGQNNKKLYIFSTDFHYVDVHLREICCIKHICTCSNLIQST